jgi:hypothetical protein
VPWLLRFSAFFLLFLASAAIRRAAVGRVAAFAHNQMMMMVHDMAVAGRTIFAPLIHRRGAGRARIRPDAINLNAASSSTDAAPISFYLSRREKLKKEAAFSFRLCGLPRNGFRPHCPSAGFRSAILDSDKPVEADLVNNLTDSIQTRKPSQRKNVGKRKKKGRAFYVQGKGERRDHVLQRRVLTTWGRESGFPQTRMVSISCSGVGC